MNIIQFLLHRKKYRLVPVLLLLLPVSALFMRFGRNRFLMPVTAIVSAALFTLFLLNGSKWALVISIITFVLLLIFVPVVKKILAGILLAIVYCLAILPIACFTRIFRKDSLMLSHRRKTFFSSANRRFLPKDFEQAG